MWYNNSEINEVNALLCKKQTLRSAHLRVLFLAM